MGILDLMNGIEAAGDRGRARGQQTALGRLFSQASTAPREQRSGLLAQMGAISPQAAFDAEKHFGSMDDAARKRLGQYAAAFSALPADQKAAAYPQLAEMGRTLGLPVPQGGYQPAYDAGIAQLGQAFGGASAGAAGVQSTYIDAQGNRVAIMRDGSTQVLGQNAPSNQIIDTGNGFFGVNKGTLQAAPVTVGGAGQYTIAPDLPPEVQADIRANEPAYAAAPDGSSRDVGQQLFSVPKPQAAPESFSTLRPEEVAAAGLPAGTFAQRNNATGEIKIGPAQAQGDKPMSEYQRQQLTLKANGARKSVRGSTDDLNRMAEMAQKVLAMPGLDRITGVMGKIPNVPGSAAADAQAQLDSLKSQISFAVLAKMRAMSPTGGALGSVSDAEGRRLEANLASLDNAQSAEQLRQNLKAIIDYAHTSAANIQSAFDEDYGEFLNSGRSGGGDSRRKALLDKY